MISLYILLGLDVFWFLISIILIEYISVLKNRIYILENNYNIV